MNSTRTVLAGLTASLAGVALAAITQIPLAIDYPKAIFHGTPKPIPLTNLDPLRERAPELLVPPRTSLLSRGRPVSASDALPVIGEPAFVTDGDKTGADGAYVEFGPGPQWVQIDLGAPSRIHAIALWHYHAELRVYHDVVVQVANDPKFATGVTTVFNNDADNSSGFGRGRDRAYVESRFGRLIAAQGAIGRYVRLHSHGNTTDELNHYCEVEVFGERTQAGSP
jgi:hypothetical protein